MCRLNFISAETAWPGDYLHIFYYYIIILFIILLFYFYYIIYSIRIIGEIAETKLTFFAGTDILCKNTQPRVFFCLFTIYHMIYRHTLNKVHHMWQLLISFKWKINLVYFKINILFHTPISETISNSNFTMAAASLSTIELNYFNDAIFSAINRIRHY